MFLRGRWRGLAPDFEVRTAESVLAALSAEGRADDEFDIDSCCECLEKQFGSLPTQTESQVEDGAAIRGQGSQPRGVIAFVLRGLTTFTREEGKPEKFRLDADKVLRFRAKKVLLDALDDDPDALLKVPELLEKVREDVVEVDEARLLKSIAGFTYLVDGEVNYLDPYDLPEAPTERLSDLFARKPQWLADELRVFLEPLMPAKAVDEFLAKNARALFRGPRDAEERFFVRRAAGLGVAVV